MDSTQPPETFLRHVLEAHFDKLYDLPENIQDVMGLQTLRPSAIVCKVMTVPNSRCVRIVTLDEHVSTGFHEILVNDMGQQDWPQVNLSEIGLLRLDWPKDLFAFVGHYQCELEQMRKVCRDLYHLCIISIWRNYGAARSPGAQFGRGRHRTVWTTCVRHTTRPLL